jgi:hypothetical protein
MIVFLLVIISVLALLITFRLLSGDRWQAPAAPAPTELPVAIDLPEKFERLLLEKNQLIDRLQKQVEAERSHRLEFEKVKELLSEEILRLKEQNRGLKVSVSKES